MSELSAKADIRPAEHSLIVKVFASLVDRFMGEPGLVSECERILIGGGESLSDKLSTCPVGNAAGAD
jgi:hypothetical protein